MLLDILETIIDALTRWSNGVGLGLIVAISLGLVLITIVISFVATQASIERKTTKAVAKVNRYLEKHPFITDENLVEFNNLMKHIPNQMRAQWQQYMVNREKKPSDYLTDNDCIEKPFKASAYNSHIIAVRTFTVIIAVLSFVFCLAFYTKSSTDTAFSYQAFLTSLLVSAADVVIGEVYLFFLKARRNSLISELYASFNNFRKSLDRAVTSMPEYVDYEILFKRKEITAGIPVLQEYLEKRARYEQEQIRKAKESEVVHENYDFSALGINGSLVMERAMRECEYFLGNKKRILAEISEIESARDMLDKNYDEKNKTSQRKMRDIKESLDRLKEKLDATTNLIVGNDLRKQRENEIQKQRQLEKEFDEDNRKYEEEKSRLSSQVESKKEEIEGFRKSIEVALNNEFMTYADKIYKQLENQIVTEQKNHMDSLNAEIVSLQQTLEDKDRIIVEKNTVVGERDDVVADKDTRIAQLEKFIEENQYNEKSNAINAKNKEIFAVKRELESRNVELEKKEKQIERQKELISELKSKKNIQGDQIYTDENGALYFVDAYGNRKYIAKTANSVEELNKLGQEQSTELSNPQAEEQLLAEELVSQPVDETVGKEPEQEMNLQSEEVNSSLGFSDSDLSIEKQLKMAMDGVDEQPAEPKQTEVTEPVAENAEQDGENLEVKQEDNAEEVHEVKNDNLLDEKPVQEVKAEDQKPLEEEKAEEIPTQELDAEAKAEPKAPAEPVEQAKENADEIEDIDKMIDEKNAELEKQQENLSKQLEKTQNIADTNVDENAEKPKLHKKKKLLHNSAEAHKKPLKKPMGEAKKVENGEKKPIKKPLSKTPEKKPVGQKPAQKVLVKNKKPEGSSSSNKPAINLNFAQFNNQLKKMGKPNGKKGK